MFGTVKGCKQDKGYGFIAPENGDKDLFFHFSALEGGIDVFMGLKVGQKVEFDIIDGKKLNTQQASNVRLV